MQEESRMKQLTNEELAEKIQNGDKSLIPILWERTYRILYRMADRTYRDYQKRCELLAIDNEDIRQECYFVFLKALAEYKQPYKFTTFFKYPFLNMRKCILNEYRIKWLKGIVCLDSDIEKGEHRKISNHEIIPDTQNQIENDIEKFSDSELLEQTIDNLTDKQKEVIHLYYYCDRTDSQISQILGCKAESVCQMRRRGLNTLKTILCPELQRKKNDKKVDFLTGGGIL